MTSSKATTVAAYLEELPAERRAVISAVRRVIRRNLPEGYKERMNWGMICYEIPLARYPETYNGQPLGCAALAAQKNYYSLYLLTAYASSRHERALRAGFAKAGKKLDMGKCCVRFKKLEDLPLDVVGEAVAAVSVADCIEHYEKSRTKRK